MHYNGPIVRPQTDADSVFIEVTVGCTHNSCTFCNFYKGIPFRVAPLEQVEADLMEASTRWPHAERVWASGGNPYALSTSKLERLAELFRKYMPQAQISTYAYVNDVLHKSIEDIRHLAALGFNDIVMGIESGDDEVLKNTNKGYTAAQIVEAGKKLEAAGVNYRVIYLGGLAGKGKGVESAKRSVGVLNQLHPYYMYLTTVNVVPDTVLFDEVRDGKFIEETEKERIEEFRTLIEEMQNPIGIFSQTSTVTVPFVCELPQDKPRILALLDRAIGEMTEADEARIQRYRRQMTTV